MCLALLAVSGAAAQQAKPEEQERTRLQRLTALGELWGQVRYRHPWMLSRRIDWDAAFLSAVPKVEAARSPDEYAAAVQSMLDALEDPATKVKSARPPATLAPPTLRPVLGLEKDVVVLDLRNLTSPESSREFYSLGPKLREPFAKARAAVVDVRLRGFNPQEVWTVSSAADWLLPLFFDGELAVPGLRSTIHGGYKPQTGMDAPYTTAFTQEASTLVRGSPGKKPSRVVFLLDEHSLVSPRMLALRAAGRALFVGEGPVTDALAVDTQDVPLGEKLTATVRTSETVLPVGLDEQLPARADLKAPDAAFARALELARQKSRPKGSTASAPPEILWRPDNAYKESPYPSRELRLLAAVRLWNVVERFFPFTHLMEVNWSQQLPLLLKRFEAARDEKEYALEVAKAARELRDGHVGLSGPSTYDEFWTGAWVPFEAQDIEGKVVVTELFDAQLAQGFSVGDVIEKVDGQPIEERLRRLESIHQGSTAASTRFFHIYLALVGPPGTEATLTVRNEKGARDVKLTRFPAASRKEGPREPFKLLEDNISYVNLAQLEPGEVAEVMKKAQGTRAIVFDLRGYPRGAADVLAPYLNVKGAKTWTRAEVPIVAGSMLVNGRMTVKQDLPTAEVPVYRGRTVTLIDERAMSHAEHTGLMLEATCGTTFVGSPTAGANGNMTYTTLPGGIWMTFTGMEIRHADGGQLQRKGLTPHVAVQPTLAGLRAGRDEVLERALRLLAEPVKPASYQR
ncbi:S41 family peptidase [Pyxidicoccus xibeiensis]|uniref:S41 family peptidase n=1 Tax=Pyxidicoccus xibeiensis TaxID=2906759 RepID=UPI0020A744E1|nr:S41 family peptidase [Pyxidicoccus xibeiensis]MCP3143804.1 S41 family peptidase [Pyxidicoccus xibeiensis]